MTKEEFLIVKEELINVIINFELLKRKSNFLKQTYLLELSDEIRSEMKYSFENEVMLDSIKKVNEKINLDQIKKDIVLAKEELTKKLENFEINLKSAQELSHRCEVYTLEDMQEFDLRFADFCKLYHPVLKGKVSEVEKTMFNLLSKLYQDGNIEAFDKLYKECESKFSALDINSNFDGYAYFYRESIKNLNNLIIKMQNSFPLNIEDKFLNYDSITALIGEKRETVYDLRELNKAIRKDFKLNFDVEF